MKIGNLLNHLSGKNQAWFQQTMDFSREFQQQRWGFPHLNTWAGTRRASDLDHPPRVVIHPRPISAWKPCPIVQGMFTFPKTPFWSRLFLSKQTLCGGFHRAPQESCFIHLYTGKSMKLPILNGCSGGTPILGHHCDEDPHLCRQVLRLLRTCSFSLLQPLLCPAESSKPNFLGGH